LISPVSQHFCPSCNRLRLTSDGKLRTCIFSDRETDLRRPLRQGADDDQLEMIIREAIASKPREHPLTASTAPQRCRRQMSEIGG
jgi:cyclic pyranopterin phosphate synthase